MDNIVRAIISARRRMLSRTGFEQGSRVPAARQVPIVPFATQGLICEIKRKSPSRGAFVKREAAAEAAHPTGFEVKAGTDYAVRQAALYREQGISTISVLTEGLHFGGSLEDLMQVKNAHPEACVLRKDFLLDTRDIDVSLRAGADAVLLMASVLPARALQQLYEAAKAAGLEALVEVHSEEEARRVFRVLRPTLLGINCRNIRTFTLDKLAPLRIINFIAREFGDDALASTRVVYESAIFRASDVRFARESGCDIALVGEAAVKYPERIALWQDAAARFERLPAFSRGALRAKDASFWKLMTEKIQARKSSKKPLVKICGLCREEDARQAIACGADALGFIFVEQSDRKTDEAFVRALHAKGIIGAAQKFAAQSSAAGRPVAIGVVVGEPSPRHVALVREGVLDALQIHVRGEAPFLDELDIPWYRAAQLANAEQLIFAHESGSPRALLDGYNPLNPAASGGTGAQIDAGLVGDAKRHMPVWLAGGLTPENVRAAVKKFGPELVDVSSGVEDSPGVKNHAKIKKFIREAKR